jgi:Lyase
MNTKLASLTRSVGDASSRSASRDASLTTVVRTEYDSLGAVEAPADRLWGAQIRRSLKHFSIGQDLMPCQTISAYALLKRSAAIANHKGGWLDDGANEFIVKVLDELLDGQQRDAVQHKRQRGNLKPPLPDCPHGPRRQGSGTFERPPQHVAVVERQPPDHDVVRRRGADERTPRACRHGALGKVAFATLETDTGKNSLPAIEYRSNIGGAC